MKKRLFKVSLLAVMAAVLIGLPQDARTGGLDKMDLQLRMLVDVPSAGKAMLGKAVTVTDGVEFVDVLIKSSDVALTEAAIDDAGGWVRSTVGTIMTAYLPVDSLPSISGLAEVAALEASKRMKYMMDTARSAANTDVASVQSTYGGTNVVVGAIDSGLDYSSPDFANAEAGSRVQYLRFQTVQGDGSVAITECANDYIENGACTIPATNDSAISHGTHVTGIAAGSDATYMGNAPGADIMLVRNDFDDDILEGGADSGTFSGGVIDGVVEIFKKSDIIDKPAVINISQGTHIGAHDNTSLMEEALNSAVTGGYATDGKSYGRVIAAAAGNEHTVLDSVTSSGVQSGGIHADVNVPDGSSHAWRLWVISAAGPGRTPLVVDGWFGTGQSSFCTVAANAYRYDDVFDNWSNFDPILPAGTVMTTSADVVIPDKALSADTNALDDDGTASIAMAVDASDSQNSKPRAIFLYGPASSTSWNSIGVFQDDASNTPNPQAYFLDVIVRASGGACTGDFWIEGGGTYVNFMSAFTNAFDVANGTNGNGYAMQDGDNNQTVAIPATASGVIAVGAYLQTKPGACSQSCWTDVDSADHDATGVTGTAAEQAQAEINGGTVQGRCPFSSIGPPAYNYSGQFKPDLMAPGDPVISVRASGFTPTYGGATNNMLLADSTHFKSQGTSQATPQITGIVALLLEKNNTLTAEEVKTKLTSTASRASSGSNEVGYGNVDAAGALGAVSSSTSGYSGTGNLLQSDLNGGGGGSSSSSCGGTIVPPSVTSAAPVAIMAMLPILLFAIRRRK